MNFNAIVAIIFVFIGCCSNVIFLELVIKDEPASGHILTFCQFLFVSLQGFIFTMDFGRKRNVIPIKKYLVLVILFYVVNSTNNMAFGYKISMPLHIIFRSGGLIASMFMCILVLGKQYTMTKYTSVAMITIGTIICTFASASDIDDTHGSKGESFITWLTGIAILTFALFLQARMGIYQECLYTKFGKHPKEALFFIHLMALPGFVLSWSSIVDHASRFSMSPTLPQLAVIPLLSSVPKLWIFLLGNTLTQFICISSVFTLTSECNALTATLVLTLRKFISLVLSIFYFMNPFTLQHWLGAVLVFGGTLLYSDVIKFESKVKSKAE